ncbi:hypothetical protein [Rhizobium sp. 1399]|uniref:hypothetical protein n=1 Tax=Rhizobium sp. 1399 TaxID=2817758 RepID=UPI002856550B|nr:hypothetical protein [Rhizobium sp. 1399]MDR6671026.1 hypothetical protein [Rhizobium sp. 1399]
MIKISNYLIAVTVCVFTAFAVSPAKADNNAWDRETFEHYSSVLRKSPEVHERLILACAKNQRAAEDGGVNAELERSSGLIASKAAEEICRRMIKGIASGAVTYEVYRQWVDTPADKAVVFPDYK